MVVIGITGTLGAGKGTVVDYLVREKGFVHFSAREFISREIKKRGLEVNRDTLTAMGNEIRATNHAGYVIEELYKEAASTGKNCIIESIRTLGEIETLRNRQNFFLLAVDAEPKLRFNRIKKRKSETDNVSFKTFLANEKREMHSCDPNNQNLSACISLADYRITNDGTVEDLKKQTEIFLQTISKDGLNK
jgi:dephospho-CoA kinase